MKMDDARIRELTREVLGHLQQAPEQGANLEARVATLEAVVRELRQERAGGLVATPVALSTVTTTTVANPASSSHPALRVLDLDESSERCILEPDKPCNKTGTCRTFGY